MRDDMNLLPPLPSADELDRQGEEARLEELRPYLLDARKNYPEPYCMLEYNGVPFSAIGGIQAVSGQKKNGKTFVIVQLMAAILASGSEASARHLPGLRVPERTLEHLGHEPRVLYVDTEMEALSSAKVLRRVHWLCGWRTDEPDERFNVLRLRSVKAEETPDGKVTATVPEVRYRLIKSAVELFRPDAVFIDGLRDVIGDFNSVDQSSALISDLMELAERKSICIWTVLHMNPRPGNDDESKMRGHLGTELGNKVTDTLVSSKKKDSATGSVTFTVRQLDARGKDMDDWHFTVTDAAGSLGIPVIAPRAQTPSDTTEQEARKADALFRSYNWTRYGSTYTDLERHVRQSGITSQRSIKQLFDTARERGIIIKDERGKYYFVGYGSQLPEDRQSSLPFEPPEPGAGDAF